MTTAPRLRSNFASNFRGPNGAVTQPLLDKRLIRLFVCSEPAIAIARSIAMCPLMAVAIVRPTNLRTLDTHLLLDFLGDTGEVASSRAVPSTSRGDAGSAFAGLSEIAGFVFLRRRGHAGSSLELGGGGNGEEFNSPMRRSVKVSWAWVGTPFSSVLFRSSCCFQFGTRSLRKDMVHWKMGPPKKTTPARKETVRRMKWLDRTRDDTDIPANMPSKRNRAVTP